MLIYNEILDFLNPYKPLLYAVAFIWLIAAVVIFISMKKAAIKRTGSKNPLQINDRKPITSFLSIIRYFFVASKLSVILVKDEATYRVENGNEFTAIYYNKIKTVVTTMLNGIQKVLDWFDGVYTPETEKATSKSKLTVPDDDSYIKAHDAKVSKNIATSVSSKCGISTMTYGGLCIREEQKPVE